MKIKHFAALLAVLLLSVGVLSGCNLISPGGDTTVEETEGPLMKDNPFEPTESGLFIRDDGTAAGAEVTDFTQDYYDLAELRTYVEGLVAEYNQEEAGLNYAYAKDAPSGKTLPVSISRLEESNGQVILILECATPADYIMINDLNLTSDGLKSVTKSTVAEMKNAGKTIGVALVNVKGETVTVEQALKNDTYHVVVCEGATVLQVQGEVKYMSTNVTYVDVDSVKTPAGEVSYIIYR